MTVNAAWHRAHPMPNNPSYEQRVDWHREHIRTCHCRRPPPDIAERLAREAPDRVRDGAGGSRSPAA